jgi:hypothetical protein
LYVAATRGRHHNHLYVDIAYDPDPDTSHGRTPQTSAAHVLAAVLANPGAETSAYETIRRNQRDAETWATVAAEYHTLANTAQQPRWDALLADAGLTSRQLQAVTDSDAHGALQHALRTAEAHHLDIATVLPHLVAARPLETADDPAAVLTHRIERFTQQQAPHPARHRPDLIAGLIPRALHVDDPDMQQALSERDRALQSRAHHLAHHALTTPQPWVRALGPPPSEATGRRRWTESLITIVAYRDHWHVTDPDHPIGHPSTTSTNPDQHREHRTATNALGLANRLSQTEQRSPSNATNTLTAPLIPDTTRGIDL